MENNSTSVYRMILVPSIITLAVTLLRLIGELQGWPELFFRRSAGGFGAIVGITWLAIVFAIYFALQLEKAGDTFQKSGKAIGLTFLSLILCQGGFAILFTEAAMQNAAIQGAGVVVVLFGLYVMRLVWPAYWKVMMTYALAARIPVIIVAYFAMRGNWGTHYDVATPDMTFTSWQNKFFVIGLLPQLFLWIPFTVVLCGLFGIITVAVRKRRAALATA